MCTMKIPRQSDASRGYEVLTNSTRIGVARVDVDELSGITPVRQRRDLLGNQPDQEDDDGSAPQSHADQTQAMELEEGVSPVRPAQHEECNRGRRKQFQRRVQRRDLEDDQQEA